MTTVERASNVMHQEALKEKYYHVTHSALYNGPGYLNITAQWFDNKDKSQECEPEFRKKYYTMKMPIGLTVFTRFTRKQAMEAAGNKFEEYLSEGIIWVSSEDVYVYTIYSDPKREIYHDSSEYLAAEYAYDNIEKYHGFDVFRRVEEVRYERN